jgi:conjugal transfer pilin signal peptidase TrbI
VSHKRNLLLVLCACMALLLTLLHFGKFPLAFGYDPNEDNCLPDVHLVLLVKFPPKSLRAGDYAFWAPSNALAHVKQQYVLKLVAGTPGDHLKVAAGQVFVNGVLVATGFSLSSAYNRHQVDFDRDEIIPAGSYFMIGTAANSNDSRYWGYLKSSELLGQAYKLL